MSRWSEQDLASRIASNPAIRLHRDNSGYNRPVADRVSGSGKATDGLSGRPEPQILPTAPHKARKYGNEFAIIDNIRFDSKKEAARYRELKLMERAGVIRELALQPSYDLAINGHLICRYRADFSYVMKATGKTVVEDVKGIRTDVFKLKRKLMRAIYDIEVLET